MATPALCEAMLASLLDFSKPFDLALFDRVVDSFYLQGDQNMEQIIVQFSNHELAWTRVDFILENSSSNYARINALNILESCVKTRWNTLPVEQQEGVKNFVVGFILKISADEKLLKTQQAFLNKLNVVLVQIVKCQWPLHWPSFIPDIVNSSKTSQSICSNNMQILLLLSEEVFDYSRDQMTSEKAKLLKQSLNKEFAGIFELCDYILGHSQNATLLSSTLRTLLCFLKWIPVEYIFETKLIETLALKFLPVPLFQNLTLQCLCDIAYLDFKGSKPQYDNYFTAMITAVMDHVYKTVDPASDLAALYLNSNEKVQKYFRYLALFITDFLRSHLELMEKTSDQTRQVLLSALAVLLRLSLIDDQESDVVIFNICLEFWNDFLRILYSSERNNPVSPLMLSSQTNMSPKLQFYNETLVHLRQVMISRMAKPEEVLVVQDENGNVVRESLKNTDSINLYISMRETLIYLTNLDAPKTMTMMCDQLTKLVSSPEWNPSMLNRLCWAIGSISKALNEQQEKAFLARVIKDLLSLVDKKAKKDHKAIIAANIMYVVGQYPRFLRNHSSFLTTVVAKLFEFMAEPHPGVQDMACDTFLKIAFKCRKVIATPQPGKNAFVVDVIQDLPNAIKDLKQSQILTFYEAVAHPVSVESNTQTREALIFKLMEIPNRMWTQVVSQANENVDSLWDNATMDMIDMILKTNSRVASSLKGAYIVQISRIYMEMLMMYKLYSMKVSQTIQAQGDACTQTVVIRKMRAIKKETLRLLTTFIENANTGDTAIIRDEFLPKLINPVLEDYQNSVAPARDFEVLQLFGAFITKFKQTMTPHVALIFKSLFPSTLQMITANFEDNPDHRINFFMLIKAVNEYCFDSLLKLGGDEFKLVMDSVFWAIKHLERTIQKTGLEILTTLITNFDRSSVANNFYQAFIVSIVNELLEVLTDTFHRSAFDEQVNVLIKVIEIVETNKVNVPLYPQGQFPNNSAFLRHHISSLIFDSFKNLTQQQITTFVNDLFANFRDSKRAKSHIQDFLIQLREFATQHEEFLQEARNNAAKAERDAYIASVPGLQYNRGNFEEDD